MITNFENITQELSDIEIQMLPLMVNGFKRYTKQNPIKEPDIVSRFNSNNSTIKLNGARLRKLVNHIRCHSMLPLIATSKGYYVSNDKSEIQNQIKSLRERANSINRCADGLLNYLNNQL
jgi:hypothetical protein